MGSKDLCTIPILSEILSTGVTSLKIEGRMKTEYYIASIVSLYRHLIDEIVEKDGHLEEERQMYYQNELQKIENRLTCVGFYKGRAGKESIITTPNSNQEVNHSYIGRIEDYQEGIAKISTRNPFALGDTIEVLSPKKELRTFQVQSIKNELGEYLEESKKPMASLYIPIPFPVEKEDFLRRISHD